MCGCYKWKKMQHTTNILTDGHREREFTLHVMQCCCRILVIINLCHYTDFMRDEDGEDEDSTAIMMQSKATTASTE